LSDHFDFKDDEMKQFVKMKKLVFTMDDRGHVNSRPDFDGIHTSSSALMATYDKRNRGGGAPQAPRASTGGGVIVID
jgi:hypothetical protein